MHKSLPKKDIYIIQFPQQTNTFHSTNPNLFSSAKLFLPISALPGAARRIRRIAAGPRRLWGHFGPLTVELHRQKASVKWCVSPSELGKNLCS